MPEIVQRTTDSGLLSARLRFCALYDRPVSGDGLNYLRETVRTRIATGFATLAQAIHEARDLAGDDQDLGVHPDDAEAAVRQLWASRLVFLASAPARRPTDDARLAAAFDHLNATGLVAWMNCGWDQDEASDLCRLEAQRRRADGYVFFHQQDAERLVDPNAVLYLGFDATAPLGRRFPDEPAYDSAAIAVGHRIAQVLIAQELDVRWDGTAATRLAVADLDWRRPLPTG